MSILITAGASPEAWRLHRTLGIKEAVIADESQLPQIPGIVGIVLPSYSAASYVHETLKACLDHNITSIYPLKWGEITELSKARALFSEYSVGLMIPSDDWLQTNTVKSVVSGPNIVVLENGLVKAGSLPPTDVFPKNETGVFRWASDGHEMQYALYII